MTTSPEPRTHDWPTACAVVGVLCWVSPLLAGFSSYFLNDDAGWAAHWMFLRYELLATVLLGLVPTFLLIGQRRLGPTRSLAVGLLASLAVHAVLVALLVVGSLAMNGQSSVTASQPQVPFYLLVAGCLALAWACRRAGRSLVAEGETSAVPAHA